MFKACCIIDATELGREQHLVKKNRSNSFFGSKYQHKLDWPNWQQQGKKILGRRSACDRYRYTLNNETS